MSISRQKLLGWSLAIVGVLMAVFSQPIVFPGLERLLGIETIVGRETLFISRMVVTSSAIPARWFVGSAPLLELVWSSRLSERSCYSEHVVRTQVHMLAIEPIASKMNNSPC
jgi:hypothetical protein